MQYYGVKNCAKLAFYEKDTGKLAAYFPFGNSMTISITGETAEATAQGSTIITWQQGRKGTMTLETQVISPRLLTIILGAISETHDVGVMTVFDNGQIKSDGTFKLQKTPSVGTLSVFLTEQDGATIITELTPTESDPDNTQYIIEDDVIRVSDANKGAYILAVYAEDVQNLEEITVKANVFPKSYEIKGVGLVKDVTGVERFQEIHIYNATAQSNVDFTYSASEPSNFTFTFDLAANPVDMKMVSFKNL